MITYNGGICITVSDFFFKNFPFILSLMFTFCGKIIIVTRRLDYSMYVELINEKKVTVFYNYCT